MDRRDVPQGPKEQNAGLALIDWRKAFGDRIDYVKSFVETKKVVKEFDGGHVMRQFAVFQEEMASQADQSYLEGLVSGHFAMPCYALNTLLTNLHLLNDKPFD